MPVRNAGAHLHASIESILGQSFDDFEFVILDDASTDASLEIARDWARRDPRIRLVASREALGLVGSSNAVVREARAAVCARMDADDVAHPDRLRRQWEVLAAHPDACLAGTLWDGIDERGHPVRPRDRWRLLRRSPFAPFPHGSIMFRRAVFMEIGGYCAAADFWEDLDLFHRMGARGRVLVLPDVLYHYRFHRGSSRLVVPRAPLMEALTLMRRCMAIRARGGDYTPLLEAPETSESRRAVDHVHALVSLGSARLWGGHAPALLPHLSVLRAAPPGAAVLHALLLGTWGEVSPATLRWALRGFVRLRDLLAGVALGDGRPVEWRFP